MGLIGAEMAFRQMRGYRMAWMPGAFSRGKSAFSFRVAYELAKNYGYRIVSNQDCIFNEPTEPGFYPDMTLRTIVVCDEGGRYLRKDADVLSFMAFAGKMDLILLVPSIEEPSPIIQTLQYQPLFGLRPAGVPLDFYEWRIQMSKFRDKGSFMWAGMEEIYGTYSTLNPSLDPRGIIGWLQGKVKEYQEYWFDRAKVPGWMEQQTINALAVENIQNTSRSSGRSTRRPAYSTSDSMDKIGGEDFISPLDERQAAKISGAVADFEAILDRAQTRSRGGFTRRF